MVAVAVVVGVAVAVVVGVVVAVVVAVVVGVGVAVVVGVVVAVVVGVAVAVVVGVVKARSKKLKLKRKQQAGESKMKLDELTIGEAKQLAQMFGGGRVGSTCYKVGEKYFIRAVTHYYTGRVVEVTDGEIKLQEAAWIADTGRFHEFLKSGAAKANEIEPYPDGTDVIVPRGGIIDASVWPHELPRTVK